MKLEKSKEEIFVELDDIGFSQGMTTMVMLME